MNSERDLAHVVRAWMAEGVEVLPAHVLDDVVAALPTTHQRRRGWRSWRSNLMNATTRLAIAGATVFVALAVGLAFVLSRPPVNPSATATATALGDCPTTQDEHDLTSARGWDSSGKTPAGSMNAGLVAAFSRDPDNGPTSVVTIDPSSGRRCTLVRFAVDYTLRNGVTQLEWSPSGDALAIALEGPAVPDSGVANGSVLIWTRDRLVRVWSGAGVQTPSVEWAPDGRSIAVWGGGLPVTVIYADGSPDRIVDIHPTFAGNLRWSPDGLSWIFAEPTDDLRGSVVSVVRVGDVQPRQLDLGPGAGSLTPIRWIDNDQVLLLDSRAAPGHSEYLRVPIAAPQNFTIVPVPDEGFAPDSNFVFSPDATRGAYVIPGSQVVIVDVTGSEPGPHFPVDIGTDVFRVSWSPDGSSLLVNNGYGVSELLVELATSGSIEHVTVAGTVDLIASGAPWQPTP
jgi:hypothetical protein